MVATPEAQGQSNRSMPRVVAGLLVALLLGLGPFAVLCDLDCATTSISARVGFGAHTPPPEHHHGSMPGSTKNAPVPSHNRNCGEHETSAVTPQSPAKAALQSETEIAGSAVVPDDISLAGLVPRALSVPPMPAAEPRPLLTVKTVLRI